MNMKNQLLRSMRGIIALCRKLHASGALAATPNRQQGMTSLLEVKCPCAHHNRSISNLLHAILETILGVGVCDIFGWLYHNSDFSIAIFDTPA